MFEDYRHLPEQHEPLIREWEGHAAVSRYVWSPLDELIIEQASNWKDLEVEALAAVTDQAGTLQRGGTYRCPPDLAARALWPEEARMP